jgi:hypothetical protein
MSVPLTDQGFATKQEVLDRFKDTRYNNIHYASHWTCCACRRVLWFSCRQLHDVCNDNGGACEQLLQQQRLSLRSKHRGDAIRGRLERWFRLSLYRRRRFLDEWWLDEDDSLWSLAVKQAVTTHNVLAQSDIAQYLSAYRSALIQGDLVPSDTDQLVIEYLCA